LRATTNGDRRGGYPSGVRCPVCRADDTRVVDSRASDDGAAIRRRRQCISCHDRFTTYERLEESVLVVLKRSGDREPFHAAKVVSGVQSAAKGRPITSEAVDALAVAVEDRLRALGSEVTSTQVGLAVLDELRLLDDVAYMRFASVYKNFDGVDDFRRELQMLAKATAPKTSRVR
jgi:transcriptional repressor NrdR